MDLIDNYLLRNPDQTPMTKEQLIERKVLTAREEKEYILSKQGEKKEKTKKERWKKIGKETKAQRQKKADKKEQKKAVARKHKNKIKNR